MQIAIEAGNFIFDLNGQSLSTNSTLETCFFVNGATVCFKDSSSEKTGTVAGGASAISITGGGNVNVESGNYKANSWAIMVAEAPGTQVKLKITGGCFSGNVGVATSIGTNYEISGGTFYGTQNAVNNLGTMKITGGTFYGEIYNGGGATLNFQGGTVIVSESSSDEKAGICNNGTLNLSGGSIFAAKEANEPMQGVINKAGASLNLLGDVTFDNAGTDFKKVETDFRLETAMNIHSSLGKIYRVTMNIPDGAENVVFANAASNASLSKGNFVSGVTGCVVDLTDNGASLYLSKCKHTEINGAYDCEACGVPMYACIGDTYYLSLAEALEAEKNAGAEEKKTVKVLRDIPEDVSSDLNISGGVFTLDFNGHTIADALNVDKGKVTIVGNGGTLHGLFIGENAYAEMSGLTIKDGVSVSNNGTFRMKGGKIDGDQIAIVNVSGTVYLEGGEILAEEIAVMNYGGTVEVGNQNGTGPVIQAPLGILNSGYQVQGVDKNADLVIRGGEITAETDIYNKTGEYQPGSGNSGTSGLPTAAGTVTLEGGTFIKGLRVAADDGVSLEDMLAEGYWYYGSNGKKLSADANTLSTEGAVTVRKSAKPVSGGQHSGGSTVDSNVTTIYAPKTGDPANIGIWIAGVFISTGVLNKIRKYKL